ncbi:hypothetical protein PEX1_001380 [Penicillium expansum]|uniref:Fringe-like glycosyltransferase domain-containing protein n=1 Tax=Penicillium expansum TaxID=27334 RepID=A0A0A2IMW3_PENEN|nr:hypothetical protein PEX2_064390 [Penicillium expansum]KGO43811.1 hypothetical protein PEXP_093820 [Penicillium expansum]KGO51977.1 hypothetical protein PEX2_064390 [Penicillium expansum]KGO55033.1 hypothetical protein PEX1_001380 [Penicillium expansum]
MILGARDSSVPGASWAWKKVLRFGVVFLFVVGFAAVLWPSVDPVKLPLQTAANITLAPAVSCDLDYDKLASLNVLKVAQYTRREIILDMTDEPVPYTQWLEQPFLEEPRGTGGAADGCSIPIPVSLRVPQPPKLADAAHIDFGVATSLERLNDSLDAFAHWAGYTRTRIFALIETDHSENGIRDVNAKADALGINLHITESDDDYLNRYFALIPLLKENARETTQWGCIIDDDTFFLSMSRLVDALAKYDHTTSMYIGGLSESLPQIAAFGIIGFGGAGVFLSKPLLTEITNVYDKCSAMDYTGDRRIAMCVYRYTQTQLTVDHRLRQLDLVNDASGFFESGREPPLTVHHWKSWFHTDMPKLAVVSELCGDSCLLRKWHFGDGWILTNGFSVIKYYADPDQDDLAMEQTWSPHNGASEESYLHELGPLRRKDEHKQSFQLQDAVHEQNDRITQWYIMRDERNGDQILELSWRKR